MRCYVVENLVDDIFEDTLGNLYITKEAAIDAAIKFNFEDFRIIRVEVIYEQLDGFVWEE